MDADEGLGRLRALGFAEADAQELWAHFDGAEQRGKQGHGHARIPWLEGLEGYDPSAEPTLLEEESGFQRWHGGGAIGYLVVGRVVRAQLEHPPSHARLVVCERTFPTGMLGHHARRLAKGGLAGVLTATSPRRLGHPSGGPKLAGTNPLAIGIPSSGLEAAPAKPPPPGRQDRSPSASWDGDPIVVDVSMGAITWGDVVAGLAQEDELVPFGGEQAHKAFALALGLQLLVDSLVRDEGHGAVLLVARPEADPVPALRKLAGRRAAAGRPLAGEARVVSKRGEVVFLARESGIVGPRFTGDPQLLERTIGVPSARLDTGQVVADRRDVPLGKRLLEDRPRGVPVAGIARGQRREDVLPGRGRVRAWLTADREHRRPCFLRDRVPSLLRVVQEDDCPPGRVDRLAVDGEGRVTADDDVRLLVRLFRVIFDDLVAGVTRRVRVDAERGDAERPADGLPEERAEDR